MRGLSDIFMQDLLNEEGILHPLLERVKQDHTLMLAIRKNYINIYYRGGNLLTVGKTKRRPYSSSFGENNYNKSGITSPTVPNTIKDKSDSDTWVSAFQDLKRIMDCLFSTKFYSEREFQQLIARENNFSKISNKTEYFVTDIEVADPDIRGRLDMLALQWRTSQRKNTNSLRPALIEIKYGDDALKGPSGLIKHLQDIVAIIADKDRYQRLLETMQKQFNQLDELGLMQFKKIAKWKGVEINREEKPEVIFILSNCNPRSSVLEEILADPIMNKINDSYEFDLRFYVSNFSGYALHADCMMSLKDFRKLVELNRSVSCRTGDSQ